MPRPVATPGMAAVAVGQRAMGIPNGRSGRFRYRRHLRSNRRRELTISKFAEGAMNMAIFKSKRVWTVADVQANLSEALWDGRQ